MRAVAAILATFIACAPGSGALADIIRLKSGGELRGLIQRPNARQAKEADADVTLRTLAGGLVVIKQSEIESIDRRSINVEEYDRRARTVADAVEARWELAEWCRAKNLKPQREDQLRRIVELDPEHEKAHYGLGHSRIDGQWIDREVVMRERGFVPYKGRYVSAAERDILEKSDSTREAEVKWFKKVRLWHGWLKNNDPTRNRDGLNELLGINDPDAIAALTAVLWEDDHDEVRRLYVKILTKMPENTPVPMLVRVSLLDVNSQVRGEALDGITEARRAAANPLYIQGLRDAQNEVIGRAAIAIRKVGDVQAVPALIEALVTSHRYKVRVADTANSYAFTTDGNFANSQQQLPPSVAAGLLTGQYPNGVIIDNSKSLPPKTRVVTVVREQRNPEVLAALETLTGEKLEYDERLWRLWWNAQKNGKFSNIP